MCCGLTLLDNLLVFAHVFLSTAELAAESLILQTAARGHSTAESGSPFILEETADTSLFFPSFLPLFSLFLFSITLFKLNMLYICYMLNPLKNTFYLIKTVLCALFFFVFYFNFIYYRLYILV